MRSLGLISDMGVHIGFKKSPTDQQQDYLVPHEYLNAIEDAVQRCVAPEDQGISSIHIPDSPIAAQIRALCAEYEEVFDPTLPPEGSKLRPMTIELMEDTIVQARPRPLNQETRERVRQEVSNLRAQGFIRESTGPFSSPVVFVRGGHKGSDKIRLCVDFKALNNITQPDKYPLPDIRAFVREAAGSVYYGSADCRQGYYQMMMDPRDVPKTAFVTPDSYEEFTRTPFGLMNAPSRFQRAMDTAFATVLHRGVVIYLDDILLHARDGETFLSLLKKALDICKEHRLRLKAPKCSFGTKSVEVVGYVLDGAGMRISETRIAAIDALQPPKTIKELQRLMGSFNYVARFVPDSSRLLAPLNALRAKTDARIWGPAQKEAFRSFKAEVRRNLSLVYPDVNAPWRLQTDASQQGYGGVLYQQVGDAWHIVSFFAGTFDKTQAKWSTYEQELFGIIACLQRDDFAPLFRTHQQLTIQSDHRNLMYLHNRRNLNAKLLRWSLFLQDYTFTLEHVPGKDNVVADQLSRADCNAIQSEAPLTDLIRRAQEKQDDAYFIERQGVQKDGIWMHKKAAIIPEDQELRDLLMQYGHRRHEGRKATLERTAELGYWRGRASDVINHVRRCPVCCKTRIRDFIKSRALSTQTDQPWKVVAIDTIGPLPVDNFGNQFIFVATDVFSKYTELVAAPANNANEAANAIWNLSTRHGVPQTIRSDNGSEYCNQLVESLRKQINFYHHRTIPHHPEANGVVKRKNQEVMRHLRWMTMSLHQYHAWTDLLPYVQHVLNSSTNSSTGLTPSEIIYGRRIEIGAPDHSGTSHLGGTPADAAREYIERLHQVHEKILEGISPTDALPEQVIEGLEPGAFVFIKPVRREKLHGNLGPYKVTRVLTHKAVEVQALTSNKLMVVAQNRVMIIPADLDLSLPEARRMEATDAALFVVSDILEHQTRPRRELYVSWEGYETPTWEPLANFSSQNTIVRAYLKKHKLRWPLPRVEAPGGE